MPNQYETIKNNKEINEFCKDHTKKHI